MDRASCALLVRETVEISRPTPSEPRMNRIESPNKSGSLPATSTPNQKRLTPRARLVATNTSRSAIEPSAWVA